MTLYVSTDYSYRTLTYPADTLISQDITINGTAYRRLDPRYYRWLRDRLAYLTRRAHDGKIKDTHKVFTAQVNFHEIEMLAAKLDIQPLVSPVSSYIQPKPFEFVTR